MLGDTLRILGITGDSINEKLPQGDAGTTITIDRMGTLVRQAQGSPWLARAVSEVIGKSTPGPGRDRLGGSVFRWLKNRVSFCTDPSRVELLRQADIMLRDIFTTGGTCVDCDEMAILGAALLMKMRFSPVFITISQRPDGLFQHVYFGFTATDPGRAGSLIALDPQETAEPGSEVRYTRRKVWPISE